MMTGQAGSEPCPTQRTENLALWNPFRNKCFEVPPQQPPPWASRRVYYSLPNFYRFAQKEAKKGVLLGWWNLGEGNPKKSGLVENEYFFFLFLVFL